MRLWRRFQSTDPGPWLVALISLLAIWPLLPPGLTHSADGFLHVYRTVGLDRLWQQGIFYQRWLPDFALGYGYPVFDFYAPLFYYLSETGHFLLGLDFGAATKAVLFGAYFLHGLGMYLFLKGVVGQRGALLAAAAYVYAPVQFRWAYLYGTYPQFLALAMAPITLWAFQRLVLTGRRRYLILGALSYAAVILSHNLTAFLFSPLLATYVLILCPFSPSPWRRLALSALGILLALGMTAFFWFPAFYDMQWVQISGLLTGTFDFRDHFLSLPELLAPSVPVDAGAHNPYMPYNLGLSQVVLAALGLAAAAWHSWRTSLRSVLPIMMHLAFLTALLAGCVLLMLPVSTPLWEALPLVTFLQFPWRLLGFAAIATAGLSGAVLLPWTGRQATVVLAIAIVVVMTETMVFTYPAEPFKDLGNVSIRDVVQMEQTSGNTGTTSGSEYLPRWVTEFPKDAPVADALLAGREPERLDLGSLPKGAEATRVATSPGALSYRVESPEAFQARFFTFYFPGWQAQVDEAVVEVTPQAGSGLTLVPIPAGGGLVRLYWQEIPHRLAADVVSLVSLLGLVIIAAAARLRGAPSPPTPSDWSPVDTALDLRTAALLAGFLLLLLVTKESWIDPYTNWFRQHSPPGEVAGCAHPMNADLAGLAKIICYEVDGDTLQAGETLRVTVFWQAQQRLSTDYVSFIQLISPDGSIWARSEHSSPGEVRSSGWFKTLYVRDQHAVLLLPEAPPVEYTLQAGLLDPETGRPLTVNLPSGDAAAAVTLQSIRVSPRQPPNLQGLSPGVTHRFGQCITLLGYRWQDRIVRPGGTLRVTLYWRADCPIAENYTVFAQLFDAQMRILGQRDGWPVGGLYPTSRWPTSEVVEDSREVTIQADTPPGQYRLAVGLYQLQTLKRLEVAGPGGSLPDGALFLEPGVEVLPSAALCLPLAATAFPGARKPAMLIPHGRTPGVRDTAGHHTWHSTGN
jgi:hypothetical protein